MACNRLMYIDSTGKAVTKPKIKYATMDDANKTARLMNSHDTQIHKIVAYKCKHCGAFHVGKSSEEIEKPKEIKREFRLIAVKTDERITENTITCFGKILEKSRKSKDEVIMEDLSTRKREELFPVKFLLKEISPLEGKFSDSYYEMYNGKLAQFEVSANQIDFKSPDLQHRVNIYMEGVIFRQGCKDKLIEKDDFTISLLDKITMK